MSTRKETSTVDQAIALRVLGPGSVTVASTTSIDFANALRETTSLLTPEQAEQITTQMAEIVTLLAGIEGETSTIAPKPKRPWWMILLPNLTNASKEEIARANHNHLVAASGVDAQQKPAPRALIRAAEAAVTAELAGSQIDAETRALLTEPWTTVHVG